MSDPDIFIIQEAIPNGKRIELLDTDMPFGRPREVAAFQSGGELTIAQNGIYNPGSDRPVIQIMQPRERPLIIKGAFRDRIYRGPGGFAAQGDASNHARFMRDAIEEIRRRGNYLNITWRNDTRQGVLVETTFSEEGKNDIAYELKFFITTPANAPGITQAAGMVPVASLQDLEAKMASDVSQLRAKMLTLYISAIISTAISSSWDALSASLDVVGITTTALEKASSSPQRLMYKVNAVVASATSVQTQINNFKLILDATRADAAMITGSADAYVLFWQSVYTTEAMLDQLQYAMWVMKSQAYAMLRSSTRLYRVQPFDTLESIAQSQLGSSARSQDLGVRQDQLVVGNYIRIPQAS